MASDDLSGEDLEAISHPYTFVCSDETHEKFRKYHKDLLEKNAKAGAYLQQKLANKDLNTLTDEQFIECLVQTKPDQIFAESTYYNGDTNWNGRELGLLGDLSCVIPTKAYDNGTWSHPDPHTNPLDVTLIYVPGPLLRSDYPKNEKPDLDEVSPGGVFNSEAYYHMIQRRLLPGLLHTNAAAALKGEELFVTVPGIGCGQFSGKFAKIIHSEFEKALNRLLKEHGAQLTQVKAVWYDNFDKEPATRNVNGIDFLIRPLLKGGLPQLCSPKRYDDKYAQCKLVSLVAWDHVSKPGNDYWPGARATDDGVKGAATDTMPALSGYKGVYQVDRVVPEEAPEMNWSDYTRMKQEGGVLLRVAENFNHYPVISPEFNSTLESSKLSEKTSSLSDEQQEEIHKVVLRLTREIESCWPYPNKDLKAIKVEALTKLCDYAKEMSIPDAIAQVKLNYPMVLEGKLSTRTADLFVELESAAVMHKPSMQ